MPPTSVLAAIALVIGLAVGAAGCGERGAPGQLEELLAVVPAEAAARGLYYSRVEAGPGLGSALPLRRADELLGVDPDDLTDVLETGGAPLTALAGRIRVRDVTEAVTTHGYTVDEEGDWTAFTRPDGVGGDADAGGPLLAAVPAGAVRDGLLVLGRPDEVSAAVAATAPAVAEPGVVALADALAGATAAAILPSAAPLVDAAEAAGGVSAALARDDVQGDLPAWDAAALAWQPDAADDADGAVLLAYERAVDGHEAARALALRAATAPLLGEGRRMTRDLFERGAPRWDEDAGVARLPVRWRDIAPAEVRDDVDDGAVLFLAPADR